MRRSHEISCPEAVFEKLNYGYNRNNYWREISNEFIEFRTLGLQKAGYSIQTLKFKGLAEIGSKLGRWPSLDFSMRIFSLKISSSLNQTDSSSNFKLGYRNL